MEINSLATITFLATYRLVCQVLEEILDARGAGLGADTLLTIRHYTALIRRHFMGDSELNELAAKIYSKHRRALDFLFEQRPDLQSDIGAAVTKLIRGHANLELDHCTKSVIRFAPKVWEAIDGLPEAAGWTPSKRNLLFEFRFNVGKLSLYLTLGPGDTQRSDGSGLRQFVFDAALANSKSDLANGKVFAPSTPKLYPKFQSLWSETWLDGGQAAELDPSEISELV